VVTMLVCFQNLAREAAGALGTRRSLRPLFLGQGLSASLGRFCAAGSLSYVRGLKVSGAK
jgi:hypothetical protein